MLNLIQQQATKKVMTTFSKEAKGIIEKDHSWVESLVVKRLVLKNPLEGVTEIAFYGLVGNNSPNNKYLWLRQKL